MLSPHGRGRHGHGKRRLDRALGAISPAANTRLQWRRTVQWPPRDTAGTPTFGASGGRWKKIEPRHPSDPAPEHRRPPQHPPPNLGHAIKSIYITLDPWVDYGFELASVFGRLDPVGGLARPPDRASFYYESSMGAPSSRSIAYNIASFGSTASSSFGSRALDVNISTRDATIDAFKMRANRWLTGCLLPPPPFPPPPHPVSAVAGTTFLGPAQAAGSRSRECRQLAGVCSTAFSTTLSTPTEAATALSRAARRSLPLYKGMPISATC